MDNYFSEEHKEWMKKKYGISIEDAVNSRGKKRDRLIDNMLCDEALLMDTDERECKLVSDILDYMANN